MWLPLGWWSHPQVLKVTAWLVPFLGTQCMHNVWWMVFRALIRQIANIHTVLTMCQQNSKCAYLLMYLILITNLSTGTTISISIFQMRKSRHQELVALAWEGIAPRQASIIVCGLNRIPSSLWTVSNSDPTSGALKCFWAPSVCDLLLDWNAQCPLSLTCHFLKITGWGWGSSRAVSMGTDCIFTERSHPMSQPFPPVCS